MSRKGSQWRDDPGRMLPFPALKTKNGAGVVAGEIVTPHLLRQGKLFSIARSPLETVGRRKPTSAGRRRKRERETGEQVQWSVKLLNREPSNVSNSLPPGGRLLLEHISLALGRPPSYTLCV